MATYTDPSTIGTSPNDPVTSEFGTAALDNPVAITEGAAGAPRSVIKSLERLAAGTQVRSQNTATFTGRTSNDLDILRFGILQIGTVNVVTTLGSGGNNTRIARLRSGTETTLGSGGAQNVDVDVIPGDTIICQGRDGTSRTYTAQIRTNGENLWPGPIDLPVEGNDVS